MGRAARSTNGASIDAASGWDRFGTLPTACATVTALLALYMLLVAINNVTDYGTNYAFVHHVLAMDSITLGAAPGSEPDPNVMWRAITSPTAQTALYVVIIAWECATAFMLIVATARWLGAFRAGSRDFAAPRRLSSIGFLMMILLFMGGFIAIGGEWFQMWRSTEWNGIDAAFRNAVLALFGVVLVHLGDG